MGATENRDAQDVLPDEQPGASARPSGGAGPAAGAGRGASAEPAAARRGRDPARQARLRAIASRPVTAQLTVLLGYIAAGIAVSWPRAGYLVDGRLPAFRRDTGAYVWGFWWVARQVEHLSNPWFTRSIAAPVGAQLGYHALMPLPGLLLTPVTLAFGAAASYNLLSVIMPGLLCYAMYRLARLWLPSQTGAIAAGAFFGLSSLLVYQSWYLLNLAAGPLFIPLALEAAVRLRRGPGWGPAVSLGVIIGGSLLTDQESAILVIIAVVLALLPWLAARPAWVKLRSAALAVVVAGVIASPQIVAMVQQAAAGGAASPPGPLAVDAAQSGIRLPGMFAPSPRLASSGLRGLASLYYDRPTIDTIGTFGLVLSVLAVCGLVVSWRRRNAWLLALLWAGCAVLAVGSVLHFGNHAFVPDAVRVHGVRLSGLLPFTWFTRIPGLNGFREASRLTLLGIVPAALLAGSAVNWLRYHARLALVPVAVLGILEAGWSGGPGFGTMPVALPALDRPIAADHSGSIVVDVPFGIKGGVPDKTSGAAFSPEAQVLATTDGHPRAVAYLARVPAATLDGIKAEPFYAGLLAVQGGHQHLSAGQLQAALLSARGMDVGWVLVWRQSPAVLSYLRDTGFRFSYRADGVLVYRPG